MEKSRKNQLISLVELEVRMIMRDGDRAYLKSLECSDLIDVLESELRFMGLYPHSDQETPKLIREILEEQIEQLCEKYLYSAEVTVQGSGDWILPTSCTSAAIGGKTVELRFTTSVVSPKIQGARRSEQVA